MPKPHTSHRHYVWLHRLRWRTRYGSVHLPIPGGQGVKNHDLAELDEVGHSTGLLEFLVESVSRSDHLDVTPELLTQLARLCKGVEQPGLVAGDPAPLIEDVAELAVEPFRAVCSAAVEQGISALLHPLNGCADLGGVQGNTGFPTNPAK